MRFYHEHTLYRQFYDGLKADERRQMYYKGWVDPDDVRGCGGGGLWSWMVRLLAHVRAAADACALCMCWSLLVKKETAADGCIV